VFKDEGISKTYMWTKDNKWEEEPDDKKFFTGDSHFSEGFYNHIFDVELGDGIIRKIPFNNNGNYFETAHKFLSREGLPKMHLATVIKHLKQNSKGLAVEEVK
jgi:hypothetical protein